MLCRKKLSHRKKKVIIFSVVILSLLILVTVLFEKIADPYQVKMIENRARVIAEEIINEGVTTVLQSDKYTYDNFTKISYSGSNTVSSVAINSVTANSFKAQLNNEIQKMLKEDRYIEYKVPLGAFTGITVLSDSGPEITINFTLDGSFNSMIKSSCTSAGVNQTVHHIELFVEARMITSNPGFTKEILFETNFEIAQTVIVGEIPNLYTGYGNFGLSYGK